MSDAISRHPASDRFQGRPIRDVPYLGPRSAAPRLRISTCDLKVSWIPNEALQGIHESLLGCLVFTTPKGRPLDPTNLTRRFRRLLRSAGLRTIRFHDLRHPAPGARRRSRRHQGTPRPRPHRRHRRRLRPRPTPPPTPSHRHPQRHIRHGQRRPRRPALRGKRPLTLPSPLPPNDREPPPSTRLVGAPILYADPNSGSRSDRHLMALPRGRKARRSLLCQVMPSVAATSSTLQLSPPRIRHDESGKEDAECLHVLSLRKINNLSHLLE